jgi:hypothetical protein
MNGSIIPVDLGGPEAGAAGALAVLRDLENLSQSRLALNSTDL